MERSWAAGENLRPKHRGQVQVVSFESGPALGYQTLGTLGLSRSPLHIGSSQRQIRQEVITFFPPSTGPMNLPAVFDQLAGEAFEEILANQADLHRKPSV